MIYYYTPIFEQEVGQDLDDQDPPQPIPGTGWTQYDPGKLDTDNATIIQAATAPGTSAPKCDKVAPRFVLACPDGSPSENGWESKTVAEIEVDYPNLIP